MVLQELTAACNAAAEETKRKASETGSTVGTIDLAIFFQGLQKLLEAINDLNKEFKAVKKS